MTFRPDAGNSTHPDRGQVEGMIAELRSIADAMELGLLDPERKRRWSLTAFDLLSRAAIRRRHKVGERPGTQRRGGEEGGLWYSDPAGSEATSLVGGDSHDPDLKAWKDWLQDVEVMLTYGRHALTLQDKATPDQQRPDKLEPCCRVCSRPKKPEPIYRAERCQWCYRFWLDWKVDAPEPILKLRRVGKVVTENAIRAAIEEIEAA